MPIRISYSSREGIFNKCERKFQLYKLLAGTYEKEEAAHFSHGHAFGAGIANYFLTKDKAKAKLACWLAYWPNILDE